MYASADATAAGRGLSALGQGIEGLAAGLKASEEEDKRKRNAVDIARAEAYKTEGLLKTQNDFDYDPDYSTYSKRAPAKTGEVVKTAANLIRDPEMRERWTLAAQSDAARVNDGIFDKGERTKREAEIVGLDDALETSRRIYVDPNTPDDVRAKAKKDIEGAIAMGGETGLLTPEAADARRKQYIEDAEFSRGKLAVERDPSVVVGNATGSSAIKAVVGRIIGAESGGNPNAKNPNSSASGIGQFTNGTWIATVRKHRPDLAGMSDGELLRLKGDPTLGREMTTRLTEDNARELGAAGLPVNAGSLYLAHFAGIGGAKAILRADDGQSVTSILGPEVTKANGFLNGMTASGLKAWAAKKMGEANPDWYNAISPEQRAAIDQQAEARRNQMSAETRGNLEVVQQNAPAAIQNTGGYDGQLPTADDFFQAYGPQDGAQKYNAFQTAVETSKNVYDMRTMSSADIENMVKDAVPKSSGDGAALEAKRYEALSSAADSVLKSRASDPAAYVQKAFPSVDAAWNSVSDGAGYQAAVGASIAAQQQLGITDIQPLPKTVATEAVKSFKDEAAPEGGRIGAISNVMMATPDPAQRRAIFDQLVKAGLPDMTEGAVEAMARGDAGAAQRLWAAALIDPSKLAGQIPGGLKPSDIDDAIQTSIMDHGQVGDIYYGLTNGSADNYLRAQRDSKLLNNAVNLRLRNGEVLSAAVEGAAKDLYGDVKTVNAGNAQILLPTDADPVPVLSGLTAQIPEVEKALKDAVPTSSGEKPSAGSKAVIDAVTQTHISNILAQGFFRNSGDGYVFIDPFSGSAVAGGDGKPMIFHPTPVDPKAAYESVSPVDILSGNDPVFGAR